MPLVLTGDKGNDVLDGGTGNDSLVGGGGADSMFGRDGADVLTGGEGNDLLDGGTGIDTLIGGAGNDRYIVDNAGDEATEAAGEGIDAVQVTLSSYTLDENFEQLTFTGTGDFNGTGNVLANSLTGAAGNDTLDGGEGTDSLYGKAGNDVLVGGTGNDVLDGGTGADTMTGGLGNDRYFVDSTGDQIVEAADEGVDTLLVTLSSYVLAADLENLAYTGTGNFNGTGNERTNNLTGAGGNDTLDGADGADILFGKAGTDLLIGGAGNDTLDGGAGVDNMSGGTGNDRYVVDDVDDQIVEAAGEGIDDVRVTQSSYTLAANVEQMVYTGTGDFNGVGNDEANTITGGTGNDTLSGGDGADNLFGKNGADVLIGGAGADRFIFTSPAEFSTGSLDRIADFSVAEGDRIRLDTIDANSALVGNQAFAFIGLGAFTGTAGQLRYEVDGTGCVVYGDINGDGVADLQLQIDGLTSLAGTDFIL